MFQRQLPDTEGEVGQPCETRTLGLPICHDFWTFQLFPKSYGTVGGEIRFLFLYSGVNGEVVFPFYKMLFLQDLFEIMLDFQRMEKLEFGGLKGKHYSENAAQMYREFSKHCQALKQTENSPLDLKSQVKLLINISVNSYCTDL